MVLSGLPGVILGYLGSFSRVRVRVYIFYNIAAVLLLKGQSLGLLLALIHFGLWCMRFYYVVDFLS